MKFIEELIKSFKINLNNYKQNQMDFLVMML
jgi:hypothetical protein